MKKTLGCLRRADQDFSLIDPGDRIAVGVSGGKDSLLLLLALSLYRKFSHKDFSLLAVTVSIGLEPFDTSHIRELCDQLEIDYLVQETEIGKIIFEYRREKNPCALCAKMRRAVLANTCVEQGCNKLALGHHRDAASVPHGDLHGIRACDIRLYGRNSLPPLSEKSPLYLRFTHTSDDCRTFGMGGGSPDLHRHGCVEIRASGFLGRSSHDRCPRHHTADRPDPDPCHPSQKSQIHTGMIPISRKI